MFWMQIAFSSSVGWMERRRAMTAVVEGSAIFASATVESPTAPLPAKSRLPR